MSPADRQALWGQFMSDASGTRQALSVTKPELRAAIDAIDQWIDDNAVSFNQAIPLPARSALSAKQKAELLMYIVRKRFEVS